MENDTAMIGMHHIAFVALYAVVCNVIFGYQYMILIHVKPELDLFLF